MTTIEHIEGELVDVIKTRDDSAPLRLHRLPDDESGVRFELSGSASWARGGDVVRPGNLRDRIEPWLTALFQSEHLSVLLGSGVTHAVHHIAAATPLPGMSAVTLGEDDAIIKAEARKSAEAAGRPPGNIEDQIRVTNELLRGLEILGSSDPKAADRAARLASAAEQVLSTFATSILRGEHEVITAVESRREDAFNYLVSFLMSFASRTGTRDRVHLFTTNYDRLIEAGAELAGLHLLDRFVGSLAPLFRSSRLEIDMHYNPPGIRGEPRYLEGVARFSKLHGSVDWLELDKAIRRIPVPFGATDIAPFVTGQNNAATAKQLMIYPNASKDRETASYPYVDLFRDLAAAVCRPNHTLICYGYSFGDEHINRVIEDMLTIPSTHLVIIAYDDPLGRIFASYERFGRHAQISVLVGPHLGDLRALVDTYLPKPAIDRTTFRMAELLKARLGTTRERAAVSEAPKVEDEGEP